MNTQEKCQQCGSPLTRSEIPFGNGAVCPRCLLGLGLSDPQATEASPSFHSPVKQRFRAPSVDQLMGRFPNLEIQHLIGYGGMGAVYQARQTQLDRPVALKILAPTLSNDEAFAQRFMREAKTLAKLSHPNIVMVFEFGKASDFHYLLMEYVDGINLRDAILEGTLSTKDALEIVPQICDALQYAHEEGVVHRDIKPENILVDKKGRVKIADFGLAKLLQPNDNDLRLTGTQQVVGTLNYMAPEQIEGRSQVDHRADIYSLGVVFYELLTGELPIGRFANPSEKIGSPTSLDDVVLRTLEKEPDRRFQQASEVKSAVQLVPIQDHLEVVMADEVPAVVAPAKPNAPDLVGSKRVADRVQTAAFNRPFGLGTPNSPPLVNSVSDLSLPFTIDQVYGGFAKAFGILKLTESQLNIEFEIRDDILKTMRSKSKSVAIGYDQIATVELVKGFYNDRIDFQTKTLAATDEVPNARSGHFSIKVKNSHRDSAETAVQFIQHQLNPSSVAVPNKSPIGNPTVLERLTRPFRGLLRWQPTFDSVKPVEVSSRFSSVRFWLITCGVLNFVFLSGSSRLQIHRWLREHLPLQDGNIAPWFLETLANLDLAANPYSTKFISSHSGLTIFFSVMMFVAAGKLDQLKSIHVVAFICAMLLLPIYPMYIVLAPWALWAFIQLMRPSTIAAFEDCQSCNTNTPAAKSERIPISAQRFISRLISVSFFLIVGSLIAVSIVSVKWDSAEQNAERTTNEVSVSDAADTELAEQEAEEPNENAEGENQTSEESPDDSDQ